MVIKRDNSNLLFSSASQASSWTQPSSASASAWGAPAAASTVPMGYNPQSMGQNLLLQPPGSFANGSLVGH